MSWNKKCIAAAFSSTLLLGITIGKISGFREMWRLRERADAHLYMAEFMQKLYEEARTLENLLDKIPQNRIFIAGRKNYVTWLSGHLDSRRLCKTVQEADAVVTLMPEAAYPGKPTYWIMDLISEEKT